MTTSISAASTVVGYWQASGSITAACAESTTTTLANGDVLVAGGVSVSSGVPVACASADLYDPTTGIWSATGSLATARFNASAAPLSNGDVLVAGGEDYSGGVQTLLNSAEVYDPSAGTWSTLAAVIPAAEVEFGAQATALSNGQVLFVGGEVLSGSIFTPTNTSYYYKPSTQTFVAITGGGALPAADAEINASTSLLAGGNVLLAGGENFSSGGPTPLAIGEVFSASTDTWLATSSLPVPAFNQSAAVLANGDALVAGGETIVNSVVTPLHTAWVYDVSSGNWSTTGNLGTARFDAAAVAFANGDVLVSGGENFVGSQPTALSSSEIYDPSAGTWQTTGPLITARVDATLALLANGEALAVAGEDVTGNPIASSELLVPGAAPTITSSNAATFTGGSTGTFAVTTTGTPTPSLGESGVLPVGVSFVDNHNGTASLAGSPGTTATGIYSITISATNATGLGAEQVFTLTISAPASSTTSTTTSTTTSAASPVGYWLVTGGGEVFAGGSVPLVARSPRASVVDIATTPDTKGYWLVTAKGNVYNFGDASFFGSLARRHVPSPVVAMAATPDGKGYWLVTARGNVDNFGDAKFFGSPVHEHHLSPIVAIAVAPDGKGYWLASRSGAVHGYGSAMSFNTGALSRPVVGIASTSDGKGYWLVTAQGNVDNFGDAKFFGSPARVRHLSRVVAVDVAPGGSGYWLVTATGNVFAYGSATRFPSLDRRSRVLIVTFAVAERG